VNGRPENTVHASKSSFSIRCSILFDTAGEGLVVWIVQAILFLLLLHLSPHRPKFLPQLLQFDDVSFQARLVSNRRQESAQLTLLPRTQADNQHLARVQAEAFGLVLR
jgi:hypothetical protein